MSKLVVCLFVLVLFLIFSLELSSQEKFEMPLSIGIYGGLNFNMHNPDFKYSEPINFPTTRIFRESSTALSLHGGGSINVPITNIFVFSGWAGYNGIIGELIPEKSQIDTLSNLNATIHYLEITPSVQFHNLLSIDRLYFLAGMDFGFPLSSNYTYSEKQANAPMPSTVDEEIPKPSTRVSLAFGLGYVFNLSEKIMLAPEATFRLPFSSVSSDSKFKSWDVSQLRLGVALLFDISGKKEPLPETPFLDVGFSDIRYYDKESNKFPLKKITVEEVQYKELFPFIPYIFCEENKESPSEEQQTLSAGSEAGEFSMQRLEPDALSINKNTLDIIGTRMNQLPDAILTITGTNNTISEATNAELAKQRAEFAKNYLIVNYGISQERIIAEAGGLPRKPSAMTDPEGVAENSRIEFSSNSKKLLAPIIIEKDKQALAEPNMVEFVTYVKTADSVISWDFELHQADRLLLKRSGTGSPDSIIWNIAPNQLSASEIPVEYSFTATTDKELTKNANGSVPVEFISISRKKIEDKPDRTISKFSLIVFDFDKADISDYDREIIEKNILPEIKYNSSIQIYGYSDRIGKEDYNKTLSERRAVAVRDILREKAKSARYEVFGVGENNILFDNNSPIGRHLSRTVQVYVITPKE